MMRFPLLVIACLLVAGCSSSSDTDMPSAPTGVDQYTVTTFDANWDSLRVGQAHVFPYSGGPNEGRYSIALPFDFPYDMEIVRAGTALSVGANGALSLLDSAIPGMQLIGDPLHRGVIAPFNGDLRQGTKTSTDKGDTSGLFQFTGTAPNRVLTIEYRAFHLRRGGSGAGQVDTLTAMQIKLYETSGVIEFIYRDHGLDMPTNDLPMETPVRVCVGLNGLSSASFKSKAHAKDTKVIPSNDLRWTPVM